MGAGRSPLSLQLGARLRPDYRYVGRFIREKAGDDPAPPILCLTATAKPGVKDDIVGYFRRELGIELRVFDGGARRANLDFVVVPTRSSAKFDDIHQVLQSDLPMDTPGGAIIYCATRRHTEEVAQFLQRNQVAADHFHAGLPPETRKHVQESFIAGRLGRRRNTVRASGVHPSAGYESNGCPRLGCWCRSTAVSTGGWAMAVPNSPCSWQWTTPPAPWSTRA